MITEELAKTFDDTFIDAGSMVTYDDLSRLVKSQIGAVMSAADNNYDVLMSVISTFETLVTGETLRAQLANFTGDNFDEFIEWLNTFSINEDDINALRLAEPNSPESKFAITIEASIHPIVEGIEESGISNEDISKLATDINNKDLKGISGLFTYIIWLILNDHINTGCKTSTHLWIGK